MQFFYTARYITAFGVANSLSPHSDNRKNNFLILGKSSTFGSNRSFDAPKKKFDISFSKANTKFCLSLHYKGGNNYLFVNGKEIFKFKAGNKNANFTTQFCLGNISDRLGALESREVSLNGNVYDFPVDKSDILNIHKYLMIKNNRKNVWVN